MGDMESLWQYQPVMCHTVPFYTEVDSQIAHKMPVLRYPVDTAHGMLHCKKRHPLLMNCFKTSCGCMMGMGGASDNIYPPVMGLTMPFIKAVDYQIAYKIPDVGYPLSTANEMPLCKEGHPLLMKCSITGLRCIKHMWGAFDSIYLQLMGPTMLFSAVIDSQVAP